MHLPIVLLCGYVLLIQPATSNAETHAPIADAAAVQARAAATGPPIRPVTHSSIRIPRRVKGALVGAALAGGAAFSINLRCYADGECAGVGPACMWAGMGAGAGLAVSW